MNFLPEALPYSSVSSHDVLHMHSILQLDAVPSPPGNEMETYASPLLNFQAPSNFSTLMVSVTATTNEKHFKSA